MIINRLFPKQIVNSVVKLLDTVETDNRKMLHLTANENTLSPLAMHFYKSSLGMRYDFGRGKDRVVSVDFFGNFAATTYPELHDIFDIAYINAKSMLHAQEVNLQCLSGAHAMLCALIGSSDPGDVIMTVREADGGHFCTEKIIKSIGRKHVFATYDVKKLTFDVDKTIQTFIKSHAKILYLDTSVLLKPHPLKELRARLPKDSIIIYDASHTLGLIMSGYFQSPLLEGADMISANTHKTFPGPHKGILAFKTKKMGDHVNSIIQNSLYSTFHTNNQLALAISIIELKLYGKQYAKQIVHNSNELGLQLEKAGFSIRKVDSVYSHNHQVHMFVDNDVRSVVKLLRDNGIAVSTSDALGGKSFIRIGTQEITKRGMKESEMAYIAKLIRNIFEGRTMLNEVISFNNKYDKILYCLPFEEK